MKILFLTFIIFLGGCTTTGQPFSEAPQPEEGKSLVYVFRTFVGYGNIWVTNFSIDDKKIVSLYDEGYSWIHVPSGEHKFSAYTPTQNNLKISVHILPNKIYYIGYGQNYLGIGRVENVLRTYDEYEGHLMISQYSYKVAKSFQSDNLKNELK